MFCPKCGTNNNPEQKYCRQCGQQLTATRVALEGGFDQALDKLKKGENALSSGVVTFAIFFCIAIVSIFLGSLDRSPNYVSALINLALGILFGFPAIVIGLLRIRRANTLLGGEAQPKALPSGQEVVQLRQAPPTDPALSSHHIPTSVTEHTTINLNPPDQTR